MTKLTIRESPWARDQLEVLVDRDHWRIVTSHRACPDLQRCLDSLERIGAEVRVVRYGPHRDKSEELEMLYVGTVLASLVRNPPDNMHKYLKRVLKETDPELYYEVMLG